MGNIKARETARVHGSIRNAGCIPEERACDLNIEHFVVVAEFLTTYH